MIDTEGLVNQEVKGNKRSQKDVEKMDQKLSQEVKKAVPSGENQWSAYPQKGPASPGSKK